MLILTTPKVPSLNKEGIEGWLIEDKNTKLLIGDTEVIL